jgi:hypothetical protein
MFEKLTVDSEVSGLNRSMEMRVLVDDGITVAVGIASVVEVDSRPVSVG